MSTNEPKRCPQRSGATRRRRALMPTSAKLLLRQRAYMFTTDGYEATTMAKVAQRAGVAVGTVYLYFQNKNDLLSAR